MRRTIGILGFVLLLAACGGGDTADTTSLPPAAAPSTTAEDPSTTAAPAPTTTQAAPSTTAVDADGCAHVVDGEVTFTGSDATVSATVRSADTGWDKYADAWEVRSSEGDVLGVRELAHPHENEQPFTRSLSGVEIPADLEEVVLAAHDSVAGWCGDTFVVALPDRP